MYKHHICGEIRRENVWKGTDSVFQKTKGNHLSIYKKQMVFGGIQLHSLLEDDNGNIIIWNR
jgi:hypothetical protein